MRTTNHSNINDVPRWVWDFDEMTIMADAADIILVALGLYLMGVLSGVVFIILGLYFYLKPNRTIVMRREEKGMLQLNVKEVI